MSWIPWEDVLLFVLVKSLRSDTVIHTVYTPDFDTVYRSLDTPDVVTYVTWHKLLTGFDINLAIMLGENNNGYMYSSGVLYLCQTDPLRFFLQKKMWERSCFV